MKLLLIILSSMMTWTVESKSLVSGSGTFPSYDMTIDYSCTYQKGDVRAGDEAVLRLGDMGNISVEYIDVYVKSNRDAGEGVFTVSSNGHLLATKDGTFEDWTGAYDNSAYHPVRVLENCAQSTSDLTVSLVGLANSLHIEKYVISYTTTPQKQVTLMAGSQVYQTLTETIGGAGVVLPELMLYAFDGWRFIGWSEQLFGAQTDRPEVYLPRTVYKPLSDMTLWAVFVRQEPDTTVYVRELASGDYLYVNSETGKALWGVPADGRMAAWTIDTGDDAMVYTVQMESDSTATLTHRQSGTPIGFSGTRMTDIASVWNIYHDGEQTLFYTLIGGKTYVLWLNIMSGDSYYAGLLKAPLGPSPMRLQLPRSKPENPLYTCDPNGTMGVENVKDKGRAVPGERVLMRFGTYEMVVKDGKKELRMF